MSFRSRLMMSNQFSLCVPAFSCSPAQFPLYSLTRYSGVLHSQDVSPGFALLEFPCPYRLHWNSGWFRYPPNTVRYSLLSRKSRTRRKGTLNLQVHEATDHTTTRAAMENAGPGKWREAPALSRSCMLTRSKRSGRRQPWFWVRISTPIRAAITADRAPGCVVSGSHPAARSRRCRNSYFSGRRKVNFICACE